MKKILFILTLLVSVFTYGQIIPVNVLKLKDVTTAQRDALSISATENPIIYNVTTGQFERWNGASWEVWAADGVLEADIDTFAELDAIVADESLVNTNNAQTLTNKTISGGSNTLSNIGLSSLQNITGPIFIGRASGVGAPSTLSTATAFNLLVTAGSINPDRLADADFGDFTVATGVASLDLLVVDTENIAVGAVSTSKLQADAVESDKILNGTVGEVDLSTSVNASLDLADSALQNVSEDLTPQLGGDLDLNGSDITGTGNVDITGNITASGDIIAGSSIGSPYLQFTGLSSEDVWKIGLDGTDRDQVYFRYNKGGIDERWMYFDRAGNLGPSGIRFRPGGQDALYLSSTDRRVGIGNTSPQEALDVTGNITATGNISQADKDWGDFSSVSDVFTLDAGVVGTSEIINGTVKAEDLNTTNSPSDGQIMTYDVTSGGFTWEANSGASTGIQAHPDSPITIDSIYVGTTAQILAANLGTDVLAFPTDGETALGESDIDTSEELAGILTDELGHAGGFVRASMDTVLVTANDTIEASWVNKLIRHATANDTINLDIVADIGNTGDKIILYPEVSGAKFQLRDGGDFIDAEYLTDGTAYAPFEYIKTNGTWKPFGVANGTLNNTGTGGSTDPIFDNVDLVTYLNPDGISETVETNSVVDWEDSELNDDFTGINQGTLNIDPSGTKQVRFDGTNDYYQSDTGGVANFNQTPGTHSFSVVFKIGESAGTAGALLSRATSLSGNSLVAGIYSGNWRSNVGGSGTQPTWSSAPTANSVVIINVNTTTYDVIVDGTTVVSGASVGTTNTGQVNTIGAYAGGSTAWDGDLEFIAFINDELTAGEITDIFTFHQEN